MFTISKSGMTRLAALALAVLFMLCAFGPVSALTEAAEAGTAAPEAAQAEATETEAAEAEAAEAEAAEAEATEPGTAEAGATDAEAAEPEPTEALADENLFNMDDPYFAEGYNYIQSTNEMTREKNSFITGYIAVEAGDIVSLNLNSTQYSEFVKYALYTTDKKWIDTVRTNSITEMQVRIFEPGFIRFSVNGLEYEETTTIYIRKDRSASEAEIPESMLMSSNETNIIVKTTDEDLATYTTDWFDRNDPDYLDRQNFVQNTSTIVEEGDSFITGFIPVKKGDAITIALNMDMASPFIKYAFYDADKQWIETKRFNYSAGVTTTAEQPGYIRFSVNGRLFKNTATIYIHPSIRLTADQQIEEVIMPSITNSNGYVEAFNQLYLTGDEIDLFNRDDEEFLADKGYRQLTEEIIPDEGSFLTGYIPVVSGQVVVVNFTEKTEFAKYALYDDQKQWISTTRVDSPTMLVVPITETGYFRFHGHDRAINGTTITIPTVKKLDISTVSGDIDQRLQRLEKEADIRDEVDVMLFMGQSNMAGRGIVSEDFPEDAPEVIDGAGWEFRSISDPTSLHAIDKQFGMNENVYGAIDDTGAKTGGLVPAFVNAYYTNNGNVPVVGVSASEGATSLNNWQPGTPRLSDAINRLTTCVEWLEDNNYKIRHKYMVWCQGENDDTQTEEWYVENFNFMFEAMKEAGIEKCFLIRIGNTNPSKDERIALMKTQTKICQTQKDVVMVATTYASMLNRGLMKDEEHYYQQAYNECGEQAGINSAYYATTGKEPFMYDPITDALYFSNIG